MISVVDDSCVLLQIDQLIHMNQVFLTGQDIWPGYIGVYGFGEIFLRLGLGDFGGSIFVYYHLFSLQLTKRLRLVIQR